MISRRHFIASLAITLMGSVAFAQEVPTTITRVVIAPARSELARAIRAELDSMRNAGTEGAQDLYYFYGGRGFEPLWLESASTSWMLGARAAALASAFGRAGELGLEPLDYEFKQAELTTIDLAVRAELAATAIAIRFGNDNFGGRLEPRKLSSNLDMPNQRLPLAELLALLEQDDPSAALLALAPPDAEFKALLAMLATTNAAPEIPQLADGPSLKPGVEDPRVPVLRERLSLALPEENSAIYDDELVAAVTAFQVELGLVADGIVGNATREALNRGNAAGRDQILVNLEKWRWLPRDRGNYRVEVNVPEYRLWVRRDGVSVHETKVVVGRPQNQTPIFYDLIRHVVVNPYWNVPTSIVRRDVAPQVVRDPGYLARREFEILTGDGLVIDPWTVNWAAVQPGSFPFLLRQKPGTQNSLGQVKFLFPNKHDVYLHDTPEKQLFNRDARAFSAGCVRVENPFDFADVLLADEPSLNRNTLERAFGPNEKWFNMQVRVPVFLTYFTVRVDEAGKARSYADVYGHDARIAAALFERTAL